MRWVIVLLALTAAGWMTFDGSRALIVGDYVTPSAGPHAGRLGPWASLVDAVGVDPRGTAMKSFFLLYGSGWIFVTIAFARGRPWAPRAMAAFAAGSLWYLVAGTISGVLQLLLLRVMGRRRAAAAAGATP